jgi:hypothetical protein
MSEGPLAVFLLLALACGLALAGWFLIISPFFFFPLSSFPTLLCG